MAPRAIGRIPLQLPHIIDQVDAPIDRGEVLRYLGYPVGVSPNARLQDILDRRIDEAACRATPRAIYVVLPVIKKDGRRLCLQTSRGMVEFRGAIGEFLGASVSVAAFIATAGPQIEQLASELMAAGDDLAAMVVNAVGAERAEAAETVVIEQLREQSRPSGHAPTLPYSPGYCGMSLTEQTKLFSLFDQDNIGVTLTPEWQNAGGGRGHRRRIAGGLRAAGRRTCRSRRRGLGARDDVGPERSQAGAGSGPSHRTSRGGLHGV